MNTDETNIRRDDVDRILALEERHNTPTNGVRAFCRRAIREDMPFEDVSLGVLERVERERKRQEEPVHVPALHLTGTRQPSFMRAIAAHINNNWREAGQEREAIEEAENYARNLGMPIQGMAVPADMLATRAALGTSDLTGMIGTEHMGGAFIRTLKPNVATMALGATVLTGLGKGVSIPKWLTGASAQWVAQNTAPTDSAPTTASVALDYHQLSSTFLATRQAIVQADPSLEHTFREDALRSIAVALDLAAIAGSGSGATPEGILPKLVTASRILPLGAAGAALTWGDVVDLQATVLGENVIGNAFGYLTNHDVKAAMMRTERATGTARFILDDATPDRLAGFGIAYSGNVPSNGTKTSGTNLSTMIFGNWSDLTIGQFSVLDVIVDPYTESAKGNTRITLHSAWDIALRYPESFAAITDIVTA